MPSESPLVVNGRFLTHVPTGVQRYAREVVRELAHLVPLVVFAPPGALIDADLGVEVRQVGGRGGHPWEQFDLPRHLRRSGAPLLLSLANTGPARYRPQIVTHHDIAWLRHPESFALSFRTLYGIVIPRLLARSERVITVSDFSAREIAGGLRIDPAKIRVVPAAVSEDFDPTGPRHDEGEPYLLAVSSPNRHKNFDALVDAFVGARLSHIRRLLIVGRQARAFRAGETVVHERVRFVGRVDDQHLQELYRGAVGFAFPSLYEGFGLPPLEAQRLGTPVLAARAASMPEVLGDGAVWVDPHDVDDIRRGIERLDGDPELRAELVRAGWANEKRFSWTASAQSVARIVDEVRRGETAR